MPIHNWSRVSDGMFHWFHQTWIVAIATWLNEGRLPEGFYAIGEVYANEVEPDVLAVEDRPPENGRASGHPANGFGVALLESPPKTRFTWEAETESYLAKKDLIAVRSVEGILVAVVEIVSAGNKSSKARFGKFLTKTLDFLDRGVHVLVVDLFPPTPRDPQGIHQAIWSEKYDGEFEFQADKLLTLASYRATTEGSVARSFVEPIAVGDALPAMPLFLWYDRYINVDLEQTYQNAWEVYPAPLKPKVERVVSEVST
jgi:hypothetical protein